MTDILPLEFQPSFLEKSMFSIEGGESENTSEEYGKEVNEFRGGYSIQFSDNIQGGGSKNKMVEGLSKIKHLSVPLGLVVNNYKNNSIKYNVINTVLPAFFQKNRSIPIPLSFKIFPKRLKAF